MPKLTLSCMGFDYLEVEDKCKLLGVIMRGDMKGNDNTEYICQKGYSRLWMIRKLKGLSFWPKMFLHLPAAVPAFILTHPVCFNSPFKSPLYIV